MSRIPARPRLHAIIMLLSAAVVTSCLQLTPAGPPSGTVPPADADAELAAVAADILAAANRTRASARLRVLQPDAALNRAAMAYAAELAARRVIDHTSPTPGMETLRRRIDAAGGKWGMAAENLARLSGSPGAVGQRTVEMWLASPPHHSVLYDASFTHAGTGVARLGRSEWVVVQLYGLPRGARP